MVFSMYSIPIFKKSLNLTPSKSSGLSAAYFGAYALCPTTISGYVLRRWGFRVTFMTGLCVLAVGCLLMWSSGVKHSFGGFCVQAVESFVAPLLASRVFFAKTVDNSQGLKNVQWTYLGVACFVALLIILFYLAPMPEITDADMSLQEIEIAEYDPGPFRKQYNLFLAVWSMFCYIGAQVSVANYFVNFCEEAGRDASTSCVFNCPLHFFVLSASKSHGTGSIACLVLVLCAELAVFATTFTLGLRGLGRHTKLGGALIVAAISGGAVFPPMTGALATHLQSTGSKKPFHVAMLIPMMAFVVAYCYPLYVNFVVKERMDERRETKLGIDPVNQKELNLKQMDSAAGQERRENAAKTLRK
ncbi:glucose galactose transporter protein [Rutstroemia sp. NJR-2017a BVV2]|nr:glucose galactose transporter protein [Rutstroemia sp. NJR-2017a BVV2]